LPVFLILNFRQLSDKIVSGGERLSEHCLRWRGNVERSQPHT
jgi:hypothetical protein